MRRISLVLLLCVVAVGTSAAQNISTVAGGGPNNVPATSANVYEPEAVATDSAGNFYIAARNGNRVFKVETSGQLTIVAGNGLEGYSGDNGPAIEANLFQPSGVAVDESGNIYIADTSNNVIRMVGTSGTITTVAGNGTMGYSGDGGLATSAELATPIGVAVDTNGNLYIADQQNSVIRKVNLSTGIITTFAGNGTAGYSGDGDLATSASLAHPSGVAVDGSGNLYIADTSNSRVRMVNSSGIISTVAGNGYYGDTGDGGLATEARLAGPIGVAVDGSDDLYIADYNEMVVRMVDSGGIISTVAGNGTMGYSGDGGAATSAELASPMGVATGPAGTFYIADSTNNRIRMVDASKNISTVAGNGFQNYSGAGVPATSASLDEPNGVEADASGNLYIADTDNNRIRKVDSSGDITTVAGNGSDGYSGDNGSATSAELNGPIGIATDGSGDIYFADSSNNVVREVDTNGDITTVAGNGTMGYSGDGSSATSAELAAPTGVAVDENGNLYIADSYNSVIRKVDTSGNITTVAGNGSFDYTGDGGAATDASLNFPNGVAVDASGNLYIADSYNSVVREVDTSGKITTVAGNGTMDYSGDGGQATDASLFWPIGVTVDASGNLYIADAMGVIREVDASTGIITTVVGDPWAVSLGDGGAATDAGLNEPSDVAVDASGNLYIADTGNNRIRKVTLGTPSPATLESISVSPADSTLANGNSLQFEATGHYSDSSTQDITNSVTWSSSKTRFASIADDGLATGLKPGVTTIEADSGNIAGSTTLTIANAALVSISITPTDAQIETGGKQQFAATGSYSDGSTKTITKYVTWSSSNTSVATIGSDGTAIGVAAGEAVIRATLGEIYNTTSLSVQATLISITLDPLNPSVAVGNSVGFTVTGHYSDGSEGQIKDGVTWSTSKPGVATIDAEGVATGTAPGKTNVKAKVGGATASTQLTVTPAGG